uniref:Proline-rich receptor-like protein kinase PERK2 n=1 Tax=Elaeis guineensis var. tenera TaxID=51953 RepID=A0A6I9QPC2_ELAGV|nr:proline-rich receptor-like protein kinase PERK2 [Elaeis guineensis]
MSSFFPTSDQPPPPDFSLPKPPDPIFLCRWPTDRWISLLQTLDRLSEPPSTGSRASQLPPLSLSPDCLPEPPIASLSLDSPAASPSPRPASPWLSLRAPIHRILSPSVTSYLFEPSARLPPILGSPPPTVFSPSLSPTVGSDFLELGTTDISS